MSGFYFPVLVSERKYLLTVTSPLGLNPRDETFLQTFIVSLTVIRSGPTDCQTINLFFVHLTRIDPHSILC